MNQPILLRFVKMYKFSVVIANYNGERYIKDCLTSVFRSYYPNFEVILIDDGSTDRSLQIIDSFKKKFSFVLIQNKKNLGLVASRNKAIKKAQGDILVFLDNDTRVDRNWFKGLEKVFSKDKTIGAAQCKIFDFKKQKIIQEIGMKLVPYTGFGTTLGRGQKDNGQFDCDLEIISLGAALAVKKEVAKKIGGFDGKLFHYTDDLDFSWRIWIAGYRVVLAYNAKVYHYTKIHDPNYEFYFHLAKNSIRMIIKNYEAYNLIKFLIFSLIFNIAGGVYVLLTRVRLYALFGVLIGIAWNLFVLHDTLKQRQEIQKLRRLSDKEIFNKIMISSNIFSILRNYSQVARVSVLLMREK